ncbi:alpha/beta fold hydrolase [Paenalcaligenes niemegkensis]|uniref:alpha/beta fold hydrolase n=1 Tax=Paenalcaligenes niemegkensis TaxID=2895469 RepID=UPI001EE93C3C|nr:alpha/beta fold hydrolase [Paenalcaligenes niemegkensis]MCQ9615840.1 alpha/beta fold hydrolase [Paenalcaligenes niemegkensis]
MTVCVKNNSLSKHHREIPDQRISQQFLLRITGGQQLFVRLLGQGRGQPVVIVHGGPGSSCHDSLAAPFDLNRFLLVMIDQRGCGRSRPLGCLRQNTTSWLIDDMESVRRHLQIQRWHVYGGSWGATLALAYAGTYPEVVQSLILRSLFLATQHEIHNLLYRTRYRRPRAWQKLYHAADASAATQLLNAINQQFKQPTLKAVRTAQAYSDLERALLMPWKPPRHQNISAANARALRAKYHIQSHYLLNRCFMSASHLAEQAKRAHEHGIGGVAIHGKHDPLCPPTNLQWLQRHMPNMQTRLVDAQHLAHEPAIYQALKEALLKL